MLAYTIHLCTFQDSKNAGSLSSLSSTPPPSSSAAPQDLDGTGAVKYSEFLVVVVVVGDNKEQDSALVQRNVVPGGALLMVVGRGQLARLGQSRLVPTGTGV